MVGKENGKVICFLFFPFFLALLEILLMLDITKASFVLFSRNRKIPYFPSVFL